MSEPRAAIDPALKLHVRNGLPPEFLALLERWPRAMWPQTAQSIETASFWLYRHGLFRTLIMRASASVDGLRAGKTDPARFAPDFAGGAQTLLGELHTHHHVEDMHYFPGLLRAAPSLAGGFDILDNDHGAIHDAIDGFAADANALLRSLRAGDWRGSADVMADRLASFDATLRQHLDDEEDLVIPLILERAAAGDPFG